MMGSIIRGISTLVSLAKLGVLCNTDATNSFTNSGSVDMKCVVTFNEKITSHSSVPRSLIFLKTLS